MKNATYSPPVTAESCAAMKVLADYRRAQIEYLHLIKQGSAPELTRELPRYAIELAEALGEAAGTHPELLAEVAGEQVAWPVLVTRHQPRGSGFEELADRIGLGSKAVVSVSSRARYRIDAPLIRFLLNLLQDGFVVTARDFYFVSGPEHQPRLTRRSLPWYLDDHVMPLLDQLRDKEGSWDGVPAIAKLVAGLVEATTQRQGVRGQIKAALLELAGPEEDSP